MVSGTSGAGAGITSEPPTPGGGTAGPPGSPLPRRFYGSVEIDMVRPVKSFDAILNAVVELQRTQGELLADSRSFALLSRSHLCVL
jgi:hypothetical protein